MDFNFKEIINNFMMDCPHIILSSSASALIKVMITLIFIPLTTHFKTGSKSKKVFYTITTNKIAENGKLMSVEDFPIYSYENAEKMQFISTVYVWTGRNKSLYGKYDIDFARLPCISLEDGVIFGAKILKDTTSPDFNQVQITQYKHSCKFFFKQLDFNNGVIIQILHSAPPGTHLTFTYNMNAKECRNVPVISKRRARFLFIALFVIDIFDFLIGYLAYQNAPNILLRNIFFVLYCIIALFTIIAWIIISINQHLVPEFVHKRFNGENKNINSGYRKHSHRRMHYNKK